MVDPAGRLADLARHVQAECRAIIRDCEYDVRADYYSTSVDPLSLRYEANTLSFAAEKIERRFSGYTEAPDAKRARCEGHPAGPFDPMGQTAYCDGSCT